MGTERTERVVIVHRSEGVTIAEADGLSRLGYDVETCMGPAYHSCPVVRGDPCPAVDLADVLIYDAWATNESESSRQLIEGLRDLYPDKPVVVTVPGILLAWMETEGPHKITPVVGVPTTEKLDEAIREALAEVRSSATMTTA